MKNIFIFPLFVLTFFTLSAQSEIEKINKVLYDYIDGTANGEPDRLRNAFDENFNLYFVANDSLKLWSGKQYINNVKPGRKSNRIGKVISIDHEGDAAMARIEIVMPARKRIYTDYMLLLKYNGNWRIVHKSFTFKNYPE